MEITDVKIRRVKKEGKTKGIASITIDNEFVVHDIKIIESERGFFVAMPSRKALKPGEFKDIAHPINSSTREKVQSAVIQKYNLMVLKDKSIGEVASTIAEKL